MIFSPFSIFYFPYSHVRAIGFSNLPRLCSVKKKDLQLISQYFRIRASDGLEFNNFLIRVMKIWLITLLPILASCWWDVGHMLSAAIAEMRLNQLNPSVSIQFRELVTSINKLVDNKSQTFIESACWADDLKARQYNMQLWNSWHFIDKPFVEDGSFPNINYTETALQSVKVVQQAIRTLSANINASTIERAIFARYLVHVVGDIHQPLHSVALYNGTFPSGDRGGNSLHIKLLNSSTQNLHAFWDAGGFGLQNDSWYMVRPLDIQNTTELKSAASKIMQEFDSEISDLSRILDPSVWAMESFRIAQNTTYPPMFDSNQITADYQKFTYETCRKRVALAGYRLANLVIDIYEKNTQPFDLDAAWLEMKKEVIKVYQSQQ